MSNTDATRYKEQEAARLHTFRHEKDERWTAVDRYATTHLHRPEHAHYAAVDYAMKLSAERELPGIEVSLQQGKWLQTQCQMIDARQVLEVGTLGGISSIWLASAGPEVRVTSVEILAERKAVAEQAIAHAGLSDRVEVILGAGMDVLPQLRKQVEEGQRPKFDFVFIDADKPSNLSYLREAIRMTRARGAIVVDNVVRRGDVAKEELASTDASVSGARAVIEAAGKEERLMGHSLLQVVGEKNYDGMLICIVK